MAVSKHLEVTAKLLQGYTGRDKIVRTISYASLLLSGISKNSTTSKKLLVIFAQLSLCRTILRLFDDVPMLAYTLSYGWGRREPNTLLQLLGVCKNAVDQMFFPLEHIAWAADNKLINIPSRRWWILSVTAWMVSLSLGILKAGASILDLQTRKRLALKQARSSQDGQTEQALNLAQQQTAVALGMLADASDLCNAINWMPEGFLWATKLTDRWVGLFGTVSSVLKLGLLIESRR